MTTDRVRAWRQAGPIVLWTVAAGVGAWTRPFGWAATALVVAAAIVTTVGAVRAGTCRVEPQARLRRAVVVWSVLVAAGLAMEMFAWARQPAWLVPSHANPTLSTLLGPLLAHGPARFAGWLIWFGAGLRLVRR